MFISKKDAEARLALSKNVLRKRDACYSGDEEEVFDEPKPAALEHVELEDTAPPIDDDATMGPTLSTLDKLDELLQPHVSGRANYRGQRDSQVAIGEAKLIVGTATASRLFDLSQDQTRAYGDGKQNANAFAKPIPEVKRRLAETKERIAEAAADRLEATLKCLSPAKLSTVKRATNLAKIGKDMAVILDKVTPKENGEGEHVHFHIFRPEFKQENHYEVVKLGGAVIDVKKD